MRSLHVPPQLPEPGPTCKIAFVGEAPSHEELAAQQPFMGPAGRVFNAMLRSAGLARAEYLITNAYDTQAEDNNVAPFMADAALTQENSLRLAAELNTAKPNVIVPLGASALWMLTGHTAITPFRGSVVAASRVAPGAKLLPTFHPAFIMRQWKLLPIAVADLVKAAKESEFSEIRYPKVRLLLEPSLADVREFVRRGKEADLLSVDIETGWGQITSVGWAINDWEAITVPFVDLRKPSKSYWGSLEAEFEAWRLIEDLMTSPVPKLGQNFTYDAFWFLKRKGIHVRNYRHDLRLMHHALYPELPKDLASMGGSYTNLGAWKHFGGRYSNEKRDG